MVIKDMTRPTDLHGHAKGTGPLRTQKPVYMDFLPPCNNACPAGENIQSWLALAQEGKHEEAWQKLVEENPMPCVHGRVCYHPCESACNRAFVDSPVSIHAVERFLGDKALEEGWKIKCTTPKSGKRVLVIGGGPSGLSAAYHLTRAGHEVEIYEAGPVAGGMMHFGIPAYRLPRNILQAEIQRILDLGVKIKLNYKVDNVLKEKEAGNFDVVFVAIGAGLAKKIDIPGQAAAKMLDAVSFLRDVETGNVPKLGRKVAVYGGGNTAMDAARTAKRLGADEAFIIYRRDRENMPAHDFEADEALTEGVKINWLRTIKAVDDTTFTVEIMELENGQLKASGRYETLEADSLILAVGQDTDTNFLSQIPGVELKKDGTVIVGPNMMTGHEGIFAGGDMTPSERTVTIATGHGKKAARYIDAYLKQTDYIKTPKHPLVGYEKLHVWYKTEAPKREQEMLAAEQRVASFDEILAGLSPEQALFEAQRCLSCGNCFECDGCYGSCPEEAVIKLGPGNRYEYDYNKCTGCAVCYEQCPVHAIEMVSEKISEK
ncbi:NAD(P)-binding protein [Chitinophagaceae bacterium LB-8]|uniref:NAD(P)-binding protein n=1 Tax=Paraflavisolibacter caeni TaxID=2982496 RepID=A0A9X2XWV0_9BACT|nr:NAD(P)-binding protein [Paraflavisolibacter caeni]MCU7550360.1 NAD(P)-binding protein [Paraflavisolibacter caeni]